MKEPLKEYRPVTEDFLRKTTCPLSAYSFAAIFLWRPFFDFVFDKIDGQLCIFAENQLGRFMLLPPLGREPSVVAVEAAFGQMEKANKGSGVTRIENVPLDWLRFFPGEQFRHYNKGYEYLYFRRDIEGLTGNRYKSKRASLNQFLRRNRAEFVAYDPQMRADCLALYEIWAAARRQKYSDGVYQQFLEDNRTVHALMLQDASELGLTGRVVVVDGKVKGYTFGFPQNDRTFCVLAEIVDLSLAGAAVYIFREFCADPAVQRFMFINAMDDMMFPSMMQTKLSFRPVLLLPAYNITRRSP